MYLPKLEKATERAMLQLEELQKSRTMSTGQVTVRIQGKAMNLLYCNPDSCNAGEKKIKGFSMKLHS